MDAVIRAIFEKVGILYIAMVIFTTSAALIFLPSSLQEQLMLQQIKDDYGRFLGPIFILSGAYLVVAFIRKLVLFVSNWNDKRKHRRLIIEKLENLTSDDMLILAEFYDPDTELLRETAALNYYDRRVKLLESYGIIWRLTSSGIGTLTRNNDVSCVLPYKLYHLAWKYVNKSMKRENRL